MKKMTKNMKKNLTWKLTELPTAGELADLVDSEVISKDEAREIMFGSAENDKEKIKALEEQIDFLRDLVTELSKNKTTTIYDWTYTRPIRYYNTPWWKDTYVTLNNTGFNLKTTDNTVQLGGKLSGGNSTSFAIGKGGYATTGYASVVDGTHKLDEPTVTMTVSANNTVS